MDEKTSVLRELGRTSKGQLRYSRGAEIDSKSTTDEDWLGRVVVRVNGVDQVLSALETELQNEQKGRAAMSGTSLKGLSSTELQNEQRGRAAMSDMSLHGLSARRNLPPNPVLSQRDSTNTNVETSHASSLVTSQNTRPETDSGDDIRAQLQKTVCLYEQERQETVKETVAKQQAHVEQQIAGLWQQVQHQLAILQDQHRLNSRKQQDKVISLLIDRGEKSQQRIQQLEEDHRQRARQLDAQLQEAIIVRQTRIQEQQRRTQAAALEKLKQLIKKQEEIHESAQAITTVLASFGQTDTLPKDVLEDAHKAVLLTSNVTRQVSAASEAGGTSDNVLQLAHTTLAQVKTIQAKVSQAIEKAQEEARKAAEAKRLAQEQAEAQAAQAAQKQAEKAATKTTPSAGPSDAKEVFLATYSQTVKRYKDLQTNLDQCVQSCLPLAKSADSQLKKYAFDLQKAVNTPLNAISSHSAGHVTDKLERLCRLLQGQQVEVSDKRVSTTSHPMATLYCKELLARKFMKQGIEQVASNHESAFPIAAVAVGVWMEFADVGDMLLAHFHRACPYIVPFYPPRMDNQSDEDFYKSRGYVYKEGTIEKQDKFLKRMSGIMRLYAAIVQTDTGSKPHPHGVSHGWRWLSNMINLDPEMDVTATLLYDFLQVAGHALMKAYGKQFHKLLHILCRDYFTEIQKVTGKGQSGPVSRLKGLLEECIKTQRIATPKGMLTSVFWTS